MSAKMIAFFVRVFVVSLILMTLGILIDFTIKDLIAYKTARREAFDRIFKEKTEQERDDLYQFYIQGQLRINLTPGEKPTAETGHFRKGE